MQVTAPIFQIEGIIFQTREILLEDKETKKISSLLLAEEKLLEYIAEKDYFESIDNQIASYLNDEEMKLQDEELFNVVYL